MTPKPKRLTHDEMRLKYPTVDLEHTLKSLTRTVRRNRVNRPSSPTSTILKEYVDYTDAAGVLIFSTIEYTRADGTKDIDVLQSWKDAENPEYQ